MAVGQERIDDAAAVIEDELLHQGMPETHDRGPFVLRFEPTKLPEHVHLESADATFLAN